MIVRYGKKVGKHRKQLENTYMLYVIQYLSTKMCGKSSRFQNMIVVDGAIIVKIGQELLRVTFVEIQENMFLSN